MKALVTYEGVSALNKLPLSLFDNDSGFSVSFAIRNLNDSIVDLTGYTIVFKMKEISATTNQISSPCVIVDAVNGICEYTFLSGDLDTVGVYDVELQLTIGLLISTIPLGRASVLADLP